MKIPEALINEQELQHLYDAVKESPDGDIIEVGVHKGGSAKAICLAKGKKKLHLFDTWEGIQEMHDLDYKTHGKLYLGRYEAPLEPVRELLLPYENVFFYKGVFPRTYEGGINKVSMMHLDVDLYEPTKAAFELFWDKMPKGGVVVLHNYPSFYGVVRAVDDFLEGKKYKKIQLEEQQAKIIKQ